MATEMTRCSARPATTSLRSAARAASATALMRATLDANVVTATRDGASLMILASDLATSVSEGERPSRMALVESQTMASTPSSPRALSFASSGGAPTSGVASSFQSPVWNTSPAGVRIASPLGSGIECASVTNSTSNGPTVRRLPSGTTVIGKGLVLAVLGHFRAQHAGRERRRDDLAAELRPQVEHGADMVFVRVRQDEADERLLFGGDEAQIRKHDVSARLRVARKGDAEIDHEPLPVLGRAVTVEIDVHADLAQAAERQEYEFVSAALWRRPGACCWFALFAGFHAS